jgi:hypothetical protein
VLWALGQFPSSAGLPMEARVDASADSTIDLTATIPVSPPLDEVGDHELSVGRQSRLRMTSNHGSRETALGLAADRTGSDNR